MSDSHLLLVDGIESGYGKLLVLNGVTFHVDCGETLAVIGHNGSGKSTLLKVLFGLLPCWSGRIMMRDDNLAGLTQRDLLAKGLVYLPQSDNVFSRLTVEENLRLGKIASEDHRQFEEFLETGLSWFPSIRAKWKWRAGDLSGGEKQMLALIRAISLSPKVLLLDEPSLGLAHSVRETLFDKIRELGLSGFTFIIVEQKVREVLKLADRVCALTSGAVSFLGPASLVDEDRLREIFL